MSDLTTPIPNQMEIEHADTAELHEFLGDFERTRYKLAGVEKRIMDELDDREDA